MITTSRISRFRQLSGTERVALLEAMVLLPVTALVLKVRGLRPVRAQAPARPRTGPSTRSLETARRIADVVTIAGRRGVVAANCLESSLVLCRLLRRHGIEAELRLGVRRAPGDPAPEFHAWVECDGVVINDRTDVAAHYAVFDATIAAGDGRRSWGQTEAD